MYKRQGIQRPLPEMRDLSGDCIARGIDLSLIHISQAGGTGPPAAEMLGAERRAVCLYMTGCNNFVKEKGRFAVKQLRS